MMEYEGFLYGKVGKSYFPLLETTDDIKVLKERLVNQEKTIDDFQRGLEEMFGLDKNAIAFFGDLKRQRNCMENRCDKVSTKDYNGHNHWVCDFHYNKLNDEFDEEYK